MSSLTQMSLLTAARREIESRVADLAKDQSTESVRLWNRVERLQSVVVDVWETMSKLFEIVLQHWDEEKRQPQTGLTPVEEYRRLKGTLRRHLEEERAAREESISSVRHQYHSLTSRVETLQIEMETLLTKKKSGQPIGLQQEDLSLIRKMMNDHEASINAKIEAATQPTAEYFRKVLGSQQSLFDAQLRDLRSDMSRNLDIYKTTNDSLIQQLRADLLQLQTSTRRALASFADKVQLSVPAL
jgi:hypothetical protein